MSNDKSKNVSKQDSESWFEYNPTLKGYYDPSIKFEKRIVDYISSNMITFFENQNSENVKSEMLVLKVSYNQIANSLNEEGIKTKRGKTWTRTAVKRLIEENGGEHKEEIGQKDGRWLASSIKRKHQTDEFAIKMRDEVLPLLDISQKHHIIAKELNDRGILTRSGRGKWGNVSVKRLLERIEELSKG